MAVPNTWIIAFFAASFLLALFFKTRLHTAAFVITMTIAGTLLILIKVSEQIHRKRMRKKEQNKGAPSNNSARRRIQKKLRDGRK